MFGRKNLIYNFLTSIFVLLFFSNYSLSAVKTTIAHKVLDMEKKHINYSVTNKMLDEILNEAEQNLLGTNIKTKQDILAFFASVDKLLIGKNIIYKERILLSEVFSPILLDDSFLQLQREEVRWRAYKNISETFYGSDCYTNSILYKAIGEIFNLPIYIVLAPEHAFVIWKDDTYEVLWETTTGVESDFQYYKEWGNISESAIANKVFLQVLSTQELLGLAIYHCAMSEEDQGNLSVAVDLYKESLNMYPNSSQTHFNLALLLINSGNISDAKVHLDSAIYYDKSFAQAYNSRGILELNEKSYKLALQDFDTALINMPDYDQALFNKGVALFYLTRYEEAIDVFSRFTNNFDFKANAYVHRAICFEKLQNDKAAISDWSILQQVHSKKFKDIFYIRALQVYQEGSVGLAISYLEKAIDLDSRHGSALNDLAWLYLSEKKFYNFTKALNLALKSVAVKKLPNRLDTLAYAYAANGKMREAYETELEAFEMAIDPKQKEELKKKLENYKRQEINGNIRQ